MSGTAPASRLAVVVVTALASVGGVAGAVLRPSSWWAVAFVPSFVATAVLGRPYVPAAYRDGWTVPAIVLSTIATLGAAAYALAVEPFGPRPVAATVLGMLLVAVLVGIFGGGLAATPGRGRTLPVRPMDDRRRR